MTKPSEVESGVQGEDGLEGEVMGGEFRQVYLNNSKKIILNAHLQVTALSISHLFSKCPGCFIQDT